MITVIIPLYNKEQSIAATLRTVLGQTYQDFEIVVVNDGSTDNSVNEVLTVNDGRIRLIQQPNAGVSAARNKGIAEAKGEFIAFLDADDEWKPEYLQTQMELTKKYPSCTVFACNYEFCDAKGKVSPTIIRKLPFAETDGVLTNYFEVASCSHPPICSISIMVRTEAIKAIEGFPVGVKSGEDLLTWARLAINGEIAYCSKPLSVFNIDEQNYDEDQRKRMPEENDVVGAALADLYHCHTDVIGLSQYVGLWHKMRTRIFLSKHCRKQARNECIKALKYTVTLKLMVFLCLTCMPYRMVDFVFKKIS